MPQLAFGFVFITVGSLIVALINKRREKVLLIFRISEKKCYVLPLSILFWVPWITSLGKGTGYAKRPAGGHS